RSGAADDRSRKGLLPDDRRLNVWCRGFGNLQADLTSLGLQLALAMPDAISRHASLRSYRFGIQKRVQRLLHRPSNQSFRVIDPLVINRDDIAQRTRSILAHSKMAANDLAIRRMEDDQNAVALLKPMRHR